MKYLPRTLASFLKTAGSQFPAILVTGARQVGKTTLLKTLGGSNRRYVTLDNPMTLSLAKEEPSLFFQKYAPPITIDEIQYAPGLLPYIKMAIDFKRKPNQFWLTGSQHFHLMKGVSESLAGRVGIVNLQGISQSERARSNSGIAPFEGPRRHALRKTSLQNEYKLIWRGSFPQISLNSKTDWGLFYGSYVQTYIQRNVRDLTKVGDETAFLKFTRIVAARTAQLLNFADLARDSDVSPPTAKSWFSILETSGLVFLLHPYFNNISKRMVKAPKMYFLDTGLCAYLTGWTSPQTLETGAMSGAFFETWVVSEILKSWFHNGIQPPLYYYRDKDKIEIDLLLVKDGALRPFEIKKTAAPQGKDIRHFASLEKFNLPIKSGGVICLADESAPLNNNHNAIPLSHI